MVHFKHARIFWPLSVIFWYESVEEPFNGTADLAATVFVKLRVVLTVVNMGFEYKPICSDRSMASRASCRIFPTTESLKVVDDSEPSASSITESSQLTVLLNTPEFWLSDSSFSAVNWFGSVVDSRSIEGKPESSPWSLTTDEACSLPFVDSFALNYGWCWK